MGKFLVFSFCFLLPPLILAVLIFKIPFDTEYSRAQIPLSEKTDKGFTSRPKSFMELGEARILLLKMLNLSELSWYDLCLDNKGKLFATDINNQVGDIAIKVKNGGLLESSEIYTKIGQKKCLPVLESISSELQYGGLAFVDHSSTTIYVRNNKYAWLLQFSIIFIAWGGLILLLTKIVNLSNENFYDPMVKMYLKLRTILKNIVLPH